MSLSDVDRASAVMLARTVLRSRLMYELQGTLPEYIKRLHRYKLFTVHELADIAGVSEYKVRTAIEGEEEFSARTGIKATQLDHLLRMIGSPGFAKLHVKTLVKGGATVPGIARITGLPVSSLYRWAK